MDSHKCSVQKIAALPTLSSSESDPSCCTSILTGEKVWASGLPLSMCAWALQQSSPTSWTAFLSQQFLQVKAEQLAEIPKLRILDWSASALFKNKVWTAGNDIVQLSLGESQLHSPTVVNSFAIEDPVTPCDQPSWISLFIHSLETERKWFIASATASAMLPRNNASFCEIDLKHTM